MEDKEKDKPTEHPEKEEHMVYSAEQRTIMNKGLLRGAMACVMRPRQKRRVW
jgi:hypothetical protein